MAFLKSQLGAISCRKGAKLSGKDWDGGRSACGPCSEQLNFFIEDIRRIYDATIFLLRSRLPDTAQILDTLSNGILPGAFMQCLPFSFQKPPPQSIKFQLQFPDTTALDSKASH